MFIPKRVTQKWVGRISREQLEELRGEFVYGTCRRSMVEREIERRERREEKDGKG